MGNKVNPQKTVDILTKCLGGKNGVTGSQFDISTVTAETLYKLQYADAANMVRKMDTMQKAEIAAEIHPILDSLYAYVNRFGNPDYPAEDQPSVALFQAGMSKIKHWETILYWLYEIDIMYDEAMLLEAIQEAEAEVAVSKVMDTDSAAISRLDTLKKKKEVQIGEGAHTDEIMSFAAQLCGKYFK